MITSVGPKTEGFLCSWVVWHHSVYSKDTELNIPGHILKLYILNTPLFVVILHLGWPLLTTTKPIKLLFKHLQKENVSVSSLPRQEELRQFQKSNIISPKPVGQLFSDLSFHLLSEIISPSLEKIPLRGDRDLKDDMAGEGWVCLSHPFPLCNFPAEIWGQSLFSIGNT